MGSNETATATTGGPRVIDLFDGNGAPSGPNCTLFLDADRPSDSYGNLNLKYVQCDPLGLGRANTSHYVLTKIIAHVLTKK